jgi:hypothetical protein
LADRTDDNERTGKRTRSGNAPGPVPSRAGGGEDREAPPASPHGGAAPGAADPAPEEGAHFTPATWFEPSEPEGLRETFSIESPGPGSADAPRAEPAGEAPEWDLSGKSGDETVVPPPREGEPEELTQVRLLVQALAKAVKATRLYPLDNPVCKKFSDELNAAFNHTFSVIEDIRLTVGKTKFFFRGEEVLEQPGREESVPGRFFWDGIREITFRTGLTEHEVRGFLDMCRINTETADVGEDDLATLFWQKQFEHIAYIAVDDILDLENPDDPVPEEFGTEYMNFVDLDMHNLEDEEEVKRVSNEFAEEIQARIRDREVELFGVSEETRSELMEEMKRDESYKLLEDVFIIILETLYLDDAEASFTETVGILSEALAGLVVEGRMRMAAALVRMLLEIREERDDLTPAMRQSLDEGVGRGWSNASCEAITGHLEANLPDVVDGFEDFLGILPLDATASLCNILVRLENERGRKRMVNALTRRAKASVDVFLPYLRDPNPEIVRDMAGIIGQTMSDKAVRPLKELMRHPSVDVRCTALDALCSLGPGKAGDVVMSALSDRDLRVRIAAARSLGRSGRAAIPALMQIMDEPEFKDRDLQEKKAYFRALAHAGGEDIVRLMEDHLKGRSLLRRGTNDEIRACACEALGIIGGMKAEALLKKHVEDKSSMVRNAARAGLRRLAETADARKRAA